MDYTGTAIALRQIYSLSQKEISIPGTETKIRHINFNSNEPAGIFMNADDKYFHENARFDYPVFIPGDPSCKKIILLFHGLNERSWMKYLSWAYYLCNMMGCFVVLFPLSFHVNRSPLSWSDPRLMNNSLSKIKATAGNIPMLTVANAALSERLYEDPMRFFYSGYRTLEDVLKLVNSIKEGKHPVLPGESTINIFAYSIGAFFAQLMIMADQENLFRDSKLFLFCGGSVFSNMHGSSKLIMDNRAFNRLYDFFLKDFEEFASGKTELSEFFKKDIRGLAFRSMIDLERLKQTREKLLRNLEGRMLALTLKNDTIIPPRGIIATMNPANRKACVGILDFQYNYTHENPFPIYTDKRNETVNSGFEKVMTRAAQFLC